MGRTKKAPPPEAVDYLLMEHFHCLPSELDKEDNARLMQFLWVRGIIEEAKADYADQQRRTSK